LQDQNKAGSYLLPILLIWRFNSKPTK